MTEECDDSKVLAFCFKCSPTPLFYANTYFKVFVFNVVGFFFNVIGTYHLGIVSSQIREKCYQNSTFSG